jgi:hypothetical protein
MGPFLKKTCMLLLLEAAVILLLYLQFRKAGMPSPMTAEINTLIMGDSRIQKAIDDARLPASRNVAVNGESLYFTYHKLQDCLSSQGAIRRVVLGLGYHSLSTACDNNVDGREKVEHDNSAVYFNHLPPMERKRLALDHLANLPLFSAKVFNRTMGLPGFKDGSDNYWGGYFNEFGRSCFSREKTDVRLNFLFDDHGQERWMSKIQTVYLDSIIALCTRKNIELILVNTPSHPYFLKNVPASYREAYGRIKKDPRIRFLDFSDVPLDDSSFLPDGDHVSVKGSKLTARILADSLKLVGHPLSNGWHGCGMILADSQDAFWIQ